MPEIQRLVNSLRRHPSWALWRSGVWRRSEGESFLAGLQRWIRERNDAERYAAAEELGKSGDARAVEPLVRALLDPAPRFRAAVCLALGRLGDLAAAEPLALVLQRDRSIPVREAAARALAEIADAEAAAAALEALMGDSSSAVQSAAAYALSRIGDASATEALIAALHAPGERLRANALHALREIGAISARPAASWAQLDSGPGVAAIASLVGAELTRLEVCESLVAALADRSAPVRASSATSIGSQARELWPVEEYSAEALGLLYAPLRDDAPRPGAQPSRRMCELLEGRAIDELVALLSDASEKCRVAGAGAIADIGGPRAIEPLIRALDDDNVAVREIAALALAESDDVRAREPLCEALYDSLASVRESAAQGLGRMPDVACLWPLVIAASRERSEHVCGTLRDATRAVLSAVGVAAGVGVMRDTTRHPEHKVRAVGVHWLGELRAGECVQPLKEALSDEHEAVRQGAAEALGKINVPAEEDAGPYTEVSTHDH